MNLARLVAEAEEIDVAFVLLGGGLGENGKVHVVLDLLNIPYQDSGVMESALTIKNNNIAKALYLNFGLTVAPWVMASPEDLDNPDHLLSALSLPVLVIPMDEDSRSGLMMSLVIIAEELPAALAKAFSVTSKVMVEEYIPGREISCGVIGNQELMALPIVESINDNEFSEGRCLYSPDAIREVCPAKLPIETSARAQQAAIAAHRALRLKGYSRTDMIVTDLGEIVALKTNSSPALCPTSLFPLAAAAHGLPFAALLDRLIELALEKSRKITSIPTFS